VAMGAGTAVWRIAATLWRAMGLSVDTAVARRRPPATTPRPAPAPPAAQKPAPPAAQKPAPPAAQKPPAAAPGPAQAAAPEIPQLIYSPWAKFCGKGNNPGDKEVCFTGKDARTEPGAPAAAPRPSPPAS